MRTIQGSAIGLLAVMTLCPVRIVLAQNGPTVPKPLSNSRAMSNDIEAGVTNSNSQMVIDTSRHLSDMSVDVIDAKMHLTSAQRLRIETILENARGEYSKLTLAQEEQDNPQAVTNIWKQRADVSRKASHAIALTLNREQMNQIARLMTEQANKSMLAARDVRRDGEGQMERTNARAKYHLHRRSRIITNEKP